MEKEGGRGDAGHYISFYWPDGKRGINQGPLGCIYLPLQGLGSLCPSLDTGPDRIFILAKAATCEEGSAQTGAVRMSGACASTPVLQPSLICV